MAQFGPNLRRSLRVHMIAVAMVGILLVGGVGGWASSTEFAGAVIASGQIVVESNVRKVQHPSGGVVGQLLVHDGSRVELGDVLIRLDETQTRANLSIIVKALNELEARQAREYADVIPSVDRPSVIDALASQDGTVDCFVQLNLTDDPARGGVADAELERMTERVLATPGLRLLGVMAVAPLDVEARRAFARVREASQRMVALAPTATSISAGMSADFRDAILQGSTHLRMGTAISETHPVAG